MPAGTINLAAVWDSLAQVQRNFSTINETLQSKREPLSMLIIENLMAGYTRLNEILEGDIDLFQREHLTGILELNHIVLCGPGWRENHEYLSHIYATQDHFFSSKPYNIGELLRWYERHRREPIWKRTAGLYAGALSTPQLFIEGNHRTGALLMSYVMTRHGLPPFVLTPENAKAYFDPSTVIKYSHKKHIRTLFRIPKIKRKFGEFLKAQSDPRFLRASDARSGTSLAMAG
ncbi:MAG: hypothetical protein AAFY56_06895 [Pseudomonadota bacterium]